MAFKENLRDELKYQDITLKELFTKTGISENTLRNYINGHNALPNIDSAIKIAKALNMSVEELYYGRDEINSLEKSEEDSKMAKKMLSIFFGLNQNDKLSVLALLEEMKKHYK